MCSGPPLRGWPAGVAAVDAPVWGSIPEASDGRLHVYVGADDEDFERVRAVLEVFGDVHRVGGPRSRRRDGISAFDPTAVKVTTKNSIIPRTDRCVIASCGRR
jgi:hypothetical protein